MDLPRILRRVILMQISSRLTMATHMLTCIDTFKDEHKMTSDFLASSINVNPVIIRKLLQQLKAAGIIEVARGTGGVKIIKPLEDITLYDLYVAVECVENGELFHFHENPNKECPVGRNIHNVLDMRLYKAQKAMEDELKKDNLADIVSETKKYILNENNNPHS
jgi:DNA-binding IscR family transcriptional regulator